MAWLIEPTTLSIVLHVGIIAAVSLRVIMLRPAPGVALAWLLLVAILPLAGLVLYLFSGERRIRKRSALRAPPLPHRRRRRR